jgi:uncharacterized OsmC-like protein
MSEVDVTAVVPPPAGATVWVERVGQRTYRGHVARGASVMIGPDLAEGFWPGELLKLALAGCAGMTADAALVRRLGDDVAVTVTADGRKHGSEDRFVAFEEHLLVDLSGLDETQQARLKKVIALSLDKACTIGSTVAKSATVDVVVDDAA